MMDSATPIFMCITIFEAIIIVTDLGLFSYGYPTAARKALWEEGGVHLFNSNPRLRIYFYANHKEPPEIPYIWTQKYTDFNLGIAILTLWVFVTRFFLRCMGVMHKYTELFLQCCVLLFWIVCLCGQRSPDYSDPKHPSRIPWYLIHSCDIAHADNQTACRAAQASFAMTIITVLFYVSSVWKIAAYEGFDYLLKKWQIKMGRSKATKPKRYIVFASGAMEEIVSEDEGEYAEDGLLMRAWDDI